MKTIKIKEIELTNFKGLRSKKINFGEKGVSIYGVNGSGKTTIFDSFYWLLFGKDSSGRSDFGLKTWDTYNNIIPKLEHEVSAVLLVSDQSVIQEIPVKRVLKEKWVKKKGGIESEFTGNTTEFYWNGVPMQSKEFQSNVSNLVDEQLFKLITNALAFNSLEWQKRRSILSSMCPVSDAKIAGDNEAYKKLIEELNQFKSIDEFKKMKSASISKSKERISIIPSLINEVSNMKPEEDDFENIRLEIKIKEAEIIKIDEMINDRSKSFEKAAEERESLLKTISDKERLLKDIEKSIEISAVNQVNDLCRDYINIENDLNRKKDQLKILVDDTMTKERRFYSLLETKASNENKLKELREKWNAINAEELVYNEDEMCCPACKRTLPDEDIERKKKEILNNFNKHKAVNADNVSKEGLFIKGETDKIELSLVELNNEIVSIKNNIELTQKEVESLSESLSKLSKISPEEKERKISNIVESAIGNDPVYNSLLKEIAELKKKDSESLNTTDEKIGAFKNDKECLRLEIDSLKDKLKSEETIKSCVNRIAELEKEEKDLAQTIADVERSIFEIESFNKKKIETIEGSVNKLFSLVKFKMFEDQINGGVSECCEAIVNGVPFSDLNTAMRINAGIDIINTLSKYYKVSAPIFIDNRESITELIETESQVINLIVSPSDKELKVS